MAGIDISDEAAVTCILAVNDRLFFAPEIAGLGKASEIEAVGHYYETYQK